MLWSVVLCCGVSAQTGYLDSGTLKAERWTLGTGEWTLDSGERWSNGTPARPDRPLSLRSDGADGADCSAGQTSQSAVRQSRLLGWIDLSVCGQTEQTARPDRPLSLRSDGADCSAGQTSQSAVRQSRRSRLLDRTDPSVCRVRRRGWTVETTGIPCKTCNVCVVGV